MKFRISFSPLVMLFLALFLFARCEKEEILSFQDQEMMQKAIEGMKMAYSKAVSNNNSLKNTTSLHADDQMMHSYDSSFHHHDSLYQHHYQECISLCSGGTDTGMMMSSVCSSKAAMMGGSMQMECSIEGKSCQHAMDSLRNDHKQYCLK